MQQPPGFIDESKPDHVCLLSKAIYGLKQSPRAWFHALSSALLTYGFKASSYDPSLFIFFSNNATLIVFVDVDDIIVTGSSLALIQEFIRSMQQQFALKDLSHLHFFLGIEVQSISYGLHLSQSKYIKDVLTRANMLLSNPYPSPMVSNSSLSRHDGDPFDDPHLYRSIVGALQYITLTRPDIAFSVNKVSQFMQSPTTHHWVAVKRILHYLKGTISHGISLRSATSFSLHAYSDADWVGSLDDRRSTSGFCIFLGSNIISWSAKKQPNVTRSSTEAEYKALAITSSELIWLQYLLAELHVPLSSSPILWCDNIGATFLASNPMFHARTKHVEIDFYFVREHVALKLLQICYLSSRDQLADIFTKPLASPRFSHLTFKLTVCPACEGG
jgi:Reverse transcriptase (RNA-dependent DNA polymerase)